jgi:hypothetical protein
VAWETVARPQFHFEKVSKTELRYRAECDRLQARRWRLAAVFSVGPGAACSRSRGHSACSRGESDAAVRWYHPKIK